ncbi:hypothetical protein C8T65DRAFT_746469 [Cerioporus squamosus]|nr:hypothetical protein C8T65DRAFT_746469 [Cerioporus squamosus]
MNVGQSRSQYYAPRPVPAVYFYPPSEGFQPQDPAFRPPGMSPNPSSLNGSKNEVRVDVDYRGVARTPSPTPSEADALAGKKRKFSLKKYADPEYLKNPRNLFTVIVTLVIIGALIAFVALQSKILDALRPASDWLRETPGAWLLPIAVMIVLSFPPLFGHELVALFCGDVWGVWIGFGIVAAGTIIGELITYCTFRYCCRGRGEKTEQKNLRYALLSEVIRDGGLLMAIMVRYSAIPAHLTTAIFATAGMSVWTFLIAAFLALPKQLAAVYLGVAENSGAPADEDGNKNPSNTTKTIKIIVITVSIVITIVAMRYVNAKIEAVKHRVIYARRKARQATPFGSGAGDASSSWSAFPQGDREAEVGTPFSLSLLTMTVDEMNQYYAPKPVPAVHFYPPPDGSSSQDPAFRVLPNASSIYVHRKEERIGVDIREIIRTPSPTPSEAEALSGRTRTFNFKKYANPEYLKNRRNLFTLAATLLVIGGLITFLAMQHKIVDALEPASEWLRETPGAWAIPIGIMIVLSFPPLLGHELLAVFCGDVWGVWIGFGIVAAGTIFGEIITYYTFRYCCRGRGEKTEAKHLKYALISGVVREGGLPMAVLVRYSAIPSHISTAIFATAGMGVWTFLIAAFLALPKQLAAVYLGVAQNSGAPVDENGNKSPTKTTQAIKGVVITLTVLITIAAMHFVNVKIDVVKHRVVYGRRKARQVQLSGSGAAAGSLNASSDWSSYPQDDDEAEAQAGTPFIPLAQRDSMDAVGPNTSTPRAHLSSERHPASSLPPSSSGQQERYDDPYGGGGIDIAALRTSPRSPAAGAQSPSRASSIGGTGDAHRT